MTEISTTQGIRLRSEFICKVYEPGEADVNKQAIEGTPNLFLENPKLPGAEATCAAVINRLPDVLNSATGFVPADKLPKPKYKSCLYETHLA